jgi:hypothetical protein
MRQIRKSKNVIVIEKHETRPGLVVSTVLD